MLQAVVKAMELLALEGKIKEKTYGKQKIYFADQVNFYLEFFGTESIFCAICSSHQCGVRQVEVTAADLSLRPSSKM